MLKFKWETEFKQSDVGEIPRDWTVEELSRLCEEVTDGSHFSPKPRIRGYPIATVKNMLDNSIDVGSCARISKEDYDTLVRNGCKPSKGDILLSKDGTVGICFVFDQDEDLVLLSSIAIIKPSKMVNSYFCKHYFSSKRAHEILQDGFLTGSALQRIVLKNLKRVPLPVPSVEEQRRIASVLSLLDEVIENKKKQNDILEKIAMAIFDKWFNGVAPAEAEELAELNEGKVPAGWKTASLYDLADWINGYPFDQRTLNVEKRGLPVIKIAELQKGISDTTQYYDGEIDSIYSLKQGDLLFAWSASIGIYIWSGENAVLNQHIFRVFPKIQKSYLYFLLKKLDFLFQRIVENKATTMGHVTVEDMKRIMTYVPDENKKLEIAKTLDPLFQKITLNQREITVLVKTKNVLLPLLVFGKLRVEEI
jgi:type I restriction enzyme S subunit